MINIDLRLQVSVGRGTNYTMTDRKKRDWVQAKGQEVTSRRERRQANETVVSTKGARLLEQLFHEASSTVDEFNETQPAPIVSVAESSAPLTFVASARGGGQVDVALDREKRTISYTYSKTSILPNRTFYLEADEKGEPVMIFQERRVAVAAAVQMMLDPVFESVY